MDLIKYSICILQDTHELTLPTLGKFELIFKSVRQDFQEQKTLPPNYQVIFSQQHDLNDDAVVQKISRSESKETEEVKDWINQTIADWKNGLKSGNNVKLEGFGTLIPDKEKIEFKIEDDCILNFKNFGLPVI